MARETGSAQTRARVANEFHQGRANYLARGPRASIAWRWLSPSDADRTYIVDFVSHSAKVVIEVDGGQHFDDAYEARDARRDKFLRSKGFRVLRFSNHDVMTNLEGVWTVIAAAVGEARPPPYPPPQAGEGLAAPVADNARRRRAGTLT